MTARVLFRQTEKRIRRYDPAFLSQVGMPLYAPSNYAELTYWLHELLKDGCRGPRAIRYPRGGENARLAQYDCSGQDYDFLHRTEAPRRC